MRGGGNRHVPQGLDRPLLLDLVDGLDRLHHALTEPLGEEGIQIVLDPLLASRLDRLNIWRDGQSQIEGQIGHIERPPIETERRACREQQPLRDAVLVDAVEIAELARTLPVWSIVLPLNMANLRRGSPVRVELGSRTLGARRSAPGAERKPILKSAAVPPQPTFDARNSTIRAGSLVVLHRGRVLTEGSRYDLRFHDQTVDELVASD